MIIKMNRLFILFFALFLICGCADTNVTSFRDPDFKDTVYKKLLIVVPFSDLDLKKTAEESLQKAFQAKEIEVLIGFQTIPPTRDFSYEELSKILKTNGIDGVLILAVSDYWKDQAYVPETSTSRGSAYIIGNSIQYNSTTNKSGGYYISKPRIKFECRLFDVKTGKVAWMATSMTRGNAFANFTVLADSLAEKIVQYLIDEKVVE
ncbi:MAG: hypothetical protein JW873_03810 [Candidatus Saganbacteria bacterium]|nr:hypothetical protein [Candidatus Saganbacteria bacterium]